MTSPDIPLEVIELLRTRVETYAELEALLLVHQQPERAFTVAEIASGLGMGEEEVLDAVDHLQAVTLLRTEGDDPGLCIKFAPESSETWLVVARLAELYSERRIEVIKLMSAHALARVRESARRTFPDATIDEEDE